MFPLIIIGGIVLGAIGIGAKLDADEIREKANRELREAEERFRKKLLELRDAYCKFQYALQDLKIQFSRLTGHGDFLSEFLFNELRKAIKRSNTGCQSEQDVMMLLLLGQLELAVATYRLCNFLIGDVNLAALAEKVIAKAIAELGLAGTLALGIGGGVLIWGILENIEASEYYKEVQKKISLLQSKEYELNSAIDKLKLATEKVRVVANHIYIISIKLSQKFKGNIPNELKRCLSSKIYNRILPNLIDGILDRKSLIELENDMTELRRLVHV